MKDFGSDILEAGVHEIPAVLWTHFQVHVEVGKELRQFIIGPLDGFAARFSQAVRHLFIGHVDPPAGFADSIEFLEDKFRLVENLKRVPARHQVELIVFEQHLRCIAVGIFDPANIEVRRDTAGIGEARLGMIERNDARRLELLLRKHGKITDAAADIGHRDSRTHAMPRQNRALMAPGHLGLGPQDRDEPAILEETLPGIELPVIFLDGNIRFNAAEATEFLRCPADDARCDDHEFQVRPGAAGVEENAGERMKGGVIHLRQASDVQMENAADPGDRLSQQRHAGRELFNRLRTEHSRDGELLIVSIILRPETREAIERSQCDRPSRGRSMTSLIASPFTSSSRKVAS